MQVKEFKKSLQQLLYVVQNDPIIPILTCVLIGKTEMVASDHQTFIIVPFDSNIEACVEAKHLKKIIDTLDLNDDVSFAYAGDEEDPWRKISVLVNGSADFTVMGDNPNDFLKVPNSKFTYQVANLDMNVQKKFNALLPFTSNDELRPSMTGICIANNKIVATDGHRLVWNDLSHHELPLVGKFKGTDQETGVTSWDTVPMESVIIPKRVIALVNKMKMDFELFIGFEKAMTHDTVGFDRKEPKLIFENQEMVIYSRPIDERYPDYESVIPDVKTRNHWNLFLDTKDFTKTIKQALTCANKTTHQIRFDLAGIYDGHLTISSEDLDFNSMFCKSIPVKIQTMHMEKTKIIHDAEGDETTLPLDMDLLFEAIGFNGKFILDFMEKLDVEAEFKLTVFKANRAGIINDNALIMPVMLNEYA